MLCVAVYNPSETPKCCDSNASFVRSTYIIRREAYIIAKQHHFDEVDCPPLQPYQFFVYQICNISRRVGGLAAARSLGGSDDALCRHSLPPRTLRYVAPYARHKNYTKRKTICINKNTYRLILSLIITPLLVFVC